jgi:hypothetical protein
MFHSPFLNCKGGYHWYVRKFVRTATNRYQKAKQETVVTVRLKIKALHSLKIYIHECSKLTVTVDRILRRTKIINKEKSA